MAPPTLDRRREGGGVGGMKKLLAAIFVALLAGCGDDAVEKLEQRVDELEDELEQVKRDQSYSRGHQRSVFGLFGGEDEVSDARAEKSIRKGDTNESDGTTSGVVIEEGVTE